MDNHRLRGIGTGPVYTEVEKPGVRHGFTRNEKTTCEELAAPNIFRGPPTYKQVLVLNDATARICALQSGQVNMIKPRRPQRFSRPAGPCPTCR